VAVLTPTVEETGQVSARVSRFDLLLDSLAELRDRFANLETDLAGVVNRLESRIDELEEFHLEEVAKSRVRVSDRARQLARWQFVSIGCGALGGLAGALSFLNSL
jgi:molecular chaperone GrpE (heat shock protein)